jgi:predicted SAM-dependent methyltransferase
MFRIRRAFGWKNGTIILRSKDKKDGTPAERPPSSRVAMKRASSGQKVHIGCGDEGLPGWVNIDLDPYPAVDVVQDVTRALPFTDCPFIFAEHFIEHLTLPEAWRFLGLCRQALADGGVLRLTTPNLDWVWATQYHPGQWSGSPEATEDCFRLNRSFYGWGHRFLYNLDTLTRVLQAAGFAAVESCSRGESRHPELRGLERHEVYADAPELPHILTVEARGRREPEPELAIAGLGDYRRDTEMPFHRLQYAALSAIRLLKRALGR